MGKYDDKMDVILHEKIANAHNDKLSDDDILAIIQKGEKIKRRRRYTRIAVLLVVIVISFSSIAFLNIEHDKSNKYAENSVITDDTEEEIEEAKANAPTLVYRPDSAKGTFYGTDIAYDTYIMKINKIEYYIENQKVFTKMNCTVIKNINCEAKDSIDITLEGGIVSISELEGLNYRFELDEEYKQLSDEEKKKTFVNLLPSAIIAKPEIGKSYIVSINQNNYVALFCYYSFLEYDTENNLYYREGVWSEFTEDNL